MKVIFIALAFLASSAAARADTAACVWGKPATVLERMESGRAGYDALLVRYGNGEPFFILLPRAMELPASCPSK